MGLRSPRARRSTASVLLPPALWIDDGWVGAGVELRSINRISARSRHDAQRHLPPLCLQLESADYARGLERSGLATSGDLQLSQLPRRGELQLSRTSVL